MAGPIHLAACLQYFPKQWFRLAIAALSVVEQGQVVEATQGDRMAGPSTSRLACSAS